jgi:hypothetical protein
MAMASKAAAPNDRYMFGPFEMRGFAILATRMRRNGGGLELPRPGARAGGQGPLTIYARSRTLARLNSAARNGVCRTYCRAILTNRS